MSGNPETRNSSVGVVFVVSVVSAAIAAAGCSEPAPEAQETPAAELLASARVALDQADTARVQQAVARIPESADAWQAGQLLAGEAAAKDGRLEDALKFYLRAADRDSTTSDGQLALFSAAEVHLELCQLTDAEQMYRSVLELQPINGITNERLAFLLSITGRRWEALKHYFVLIQGGDATYRELGLAADVGREIEQPEFLDKCRNLAPEDLQVRAALASHAFAEGLPQARELLESLLADAPQLLANQAMLGELLVDLSQDAEVVRWHNSLPADAETSPDIWFVRGLCARKHGRLEIAADCFWQALIRTPFYRRAYYQLGQVLIALDDPQAEQIAHYSELLIKLSQAIDQVLLSEGRAEHGMRRTAEILEELGRIWEACAWGVAGRRQFPQAQWPSTIFERHQHRLNDQLPWIDPQFNPVAGRQRAAVPGFDRLMSEMADRSSEVGTADARPAIADSQIRFEEVAVISFDYVNGDDPATKGVRTFEQTGGGVGIIDFDCDGFPDVCLPQGLPWKMGETLPTPASDLRDGLFRNRQGQWFEDVSRQLSGPDSGFGQGCTAADFNNDGFADLYIANVGRNALYQNMGDGTFLNVTDQAGLVDDSWTVSAAVCDLNADGLPDIFDVNYLTGKNIYEKICQGRACAPRIFPGSQDRVFLNQGNGQFHELPDATPPTDAKGLGVLAMQPSAEGRPALFVANDQVANFFMRCEPGDNAANLQLSNDALASGVAFNEDGLALACMGVATDDWDGNGYPDLFVTNFYEEPNTLYLQDPSGMFVDGTKAAGLYSASMFMTGWGTQSLDADHDGWPDLVLVNGHVDDYRDEGGPYRMLPQFFQNLGGHFRELTADDVGAWFAKPSLGRAVARVDWNRDGLTDFIASRIKDPLSVMQNASTGAGHSFRVRLHATRTARDAFGTRIIMHIDGREVTRQLLAGDGYMATNERTVEFGLGRTDTVDRVVVHWPSGATSLLTSPPVDGEFIIVEGSPVATRVGGAQQPTSWPVSTEGDSS